jgi:cobalt-zinc-cadmium efflux system outer membrane protein
MLARLARWLVPALSLAGCAPAVGRAPLDAASASDDRALHERTSERAADDRALRGAVLERAPFVRAVLDRNPTIESSRQAWRAAIARARSSGALEDPMIEVAVAPLSIGSSTARFGYEIGVSQKVPWFGKLAIESAIASAEAEAAKSDFEAARRDLALTAALLYDQYFVAVRSLEVNAAHVDLLRAFHSGAMAQFAAGRGSAQDPLAAEVELTHLEHDAIVLASERDIAVAQMNELLHRDSEEPLPPPPNELGAPRAADTRGRKRLEEEAVAHRPDLASARMRARAEAQRVERAGREYYPDVTLSTSYNAMWDMPEHRWMVGLSFNLPIQTGRRSGAALEAEASRARMESEVARADRMARTEVSVAMKRVDEASHVLHIFEERLLPLARDQVDAARAGFVASQNAFTAVIDAEKNLRRVELDYHMARATLDRRQAELDRALGRIPGLDAADSREVPR